MDTAGKLTWAQFTALSQAGNKLKLAAARFQVCQDRVNLANHGFQPESSLYPFGSFNSTVETQVAQYCGDNSGRGVAGVNDKTVFAETIPPANISAAAATRTRSRL